MPTYKEINFEEHIEARLNQSGYRSLQPTDYDKYFCLIPDEVLQFIRTTQLKAYQSWNVSMGRRHQLNSLSVSATRLRVEVCWTCLRKGVKDRSCSFDLTYFQPSSGMNLDHQRLYAQNRFTLIRQLHYSQRNEKSIDMVLFLNGSAFGDNGTQEQSHRADGDGCGETVPDRPGSKRAVVPIQAVSGSLCSRAMRRFQ